MELRRVETRVDRELLDAVRMIATEEGRGESNVIEEALRRYLAASSRSRVGESFGDIFARVEEWQRRRGVEPLSDEEAMKLAVEEQHAPRRGERSEPSSTRTSLSPRSSLQTESPRVF